VDAETLEMVVNLGFEREHVVDALRHQLRNKATVAYFLLLDNRRNLFGGYLGAEFEAGELPQRRGSVGDAVGSNGKGVGPRRPSQVQAHLMQQRLVAEQRWMLGSTTRMAPAEVMAEIFRVLRFMNVSWKKLGAYNLKCLYKLAAVAVHGENGDVGHAGGVRAGERHAREGHTRQIRDPGVQDEGRAVHDRLPAHGRGCDDLHGRGGGDDEEPEVDVKKGV
jgi:5'-AMP-activated protein kinase catalytic alpha subunit